MQSATDGAEYAAPAETPVLLGTKRGSTAEKQASRSSHPRSDSLVGKKVCFLARDTTDDVALNPTLGRLSESVQYDDIDLSRCWASLNTGRQ